MKLLAVLLFVLPFVTSDDQVVVLDSSVTKNSPLVLPCGDLDALKDNDTIIWIYTDSEGTNQTLEGYNPMINITDNKATGDYSCNVNEREVVNYLAAKLTTAIILNTRKSVTYSDGDKDRKITCAVDGSFPNPEFVWKRRGDIEGEAPVLVSPEINPNYRINSTGDRSVLLFYNVTYLYEATYICDVKNAAGNTSVEVLIRVKDKYAAVWPFLGIVIEVVVLITVIFLYEKRSRKNTNDDDDVVEAEDEKPLRSDEGTEVRNRNGKK